MMAGRYWLALNWSFIVWLAIAFLGLVQGCVYFFSQSELNEQLVQLEHQMHATKQQVLERAKYQQDIAFYQSHSAHWQQQGLTQPANPNQLIAEWAALQQEWALPHMQFDIQPSMSCEGQACSQYWSGDISAFGLSMTITPVKLRWVVANETEVIDWLEKLQHQYQGMLRVRSCTWSLGEAADSIVAECELQLFNFPNLVPGQPALQT